MRQASVEAHHIYVNWDLHNYRLNLRIYSIQSSHMDFAPATLGRRVVANI
jgi:hypothetical protein